MCSPNELEFTEEPFSPRSLHTHRCSWRCPVLLQRRRLLPLAASFLALALSPAVACIWEAAPLLSGLFCLRMLSCNSAQRHPINDCLLWGFMSVWFANTCCLSNTFFQLGTLCKLSNFLGHGNQKVTPHAHPSKKEEEIWLNDFPAWLIFLPLPLPSSLSSFYALFLFLYLCSTKIFYF